MRNLDFISFISILYRWRPWGTNQHPFFLVFSFYLPKLNKLMYIVLDNKCYKFLHWWTTRLKTQVGTTSTTNTNTNWCVMTSKVIKRCSDFVTQLTIHDILRNSKNNVWKIGLTVRKWHWTVFTILVIFRV